MSEISRPRRPFRPRSAVVVLIALVTLSVASCSAGEADSGASGDRVASVPQASEAGAATPTRAVQAEDQRPLVRTDATEQESKRLYLTWEKCLVEKGGSRYRGWGEVARVKGVDHRATKDAAQTACSAQLPETYEEREQRTDLSAFKDDNLQMYRCAKAKGYHLGAPDPDTGQFGLTSIGPQGDAGSAGMEECRRKAFAGK